MGKEPEQKPGEQVEEEVWNAIAAFEQILEAMPNDLVSLETLSDAYEKVGDRTRARDYLSRLARVLVESADGEAAGALLEKLRKYEADDPEIKDLVKEIEALAPKGGAVVPKKAAAQHVAVNITGDLSFAWNLLQARELTQEEYSQIIQELSDSSTEDALVTLSVLHVLQAHNFPTIEKIIGVVGKECSTPIISVARFELDAEVIGQLPLEFMIRRGTIAFEKMGKDVLVVVMNPYDQQLRKEVEGLIGRSCHFFLTSPRDFDDAIEKIKAMDLG